MPWCGSGVEIRSYLQNMGSIIASSSLLYPLELICILKFKERVIPLLQERILGQKQNHHTLLSITGFCLWSFSGQYHWGKEDQTPVLTVPGAGILLQTLVGMQAGIWGLRQMAVISIKNNCDPASTALQMYIALIWGYVWAISFQLGHAKTFRRLCCCFLSLLLVLQVK